MSNLTPSSFWHPMYHSKATEVLSVINLPGTKALWELEITQGSMDFIQFVRTLEISLDTTFPKLMGRYSMIFCGLPLFGNKNYMCIIHFV